MLKQKNQNCCLEIAYYSKQLTKKKLKLLQLSKISIQKHNRQTAPNNTIVTQNGIENKTVEYQERA